MGRTWEQLRGNTERFAARIAFAEDPDEGQGATVEESASWGSFAFYAHIRNLCAHSESGEDLDSVPLGRGVPSG